MLKFFKSSFIVSIIGLGLAAFVGWEYHHTAFGAFEALFIALILSLLEISISFDNAIVNATVLKKMTPLWQHRFITWGMLIAVFGMRVIFPLIVVSVAAMISPWSALKIATFHPDQYAQLMTQAHIPVSAFGGAFLMMVALKYFFDDTKELHWIRAIEKPLTKLGKMEAIEIGIVILFLFVMMRLLPQHEQISFIVSGLMGLLTYIIVDGLGGLLSHDEENEHESKKNNSSPHKTSLFLFLYLEVLDASFSFDGVIGAFAISNNLFIIAIGLGIGAMFVRSLTIMFVRQNTLSQFRYLEHGAFYAIWSLSIIMFLNTLTEIPEIVTGVIGAAFIGISLFSSLKEGRT